jgi:cytochrome P450
MDIDPLDLISPAHYAEKGAPYEGWAQLRQEPLRYFEPEGFEPFWAITRHADIMEISRQPDRFSNTGGIVVLNDGQLARRAVSENPLSKMKTIIEMDPPDHRMFRKVASAYFTPKGIERLDEIVTTSAGEVLDALGSEGEADFVAQVAQRHPLRVLCTILGVPRDQEDHLLELTSQLLASDDPDLQRQAEDRNQASYDLGVEFYSMFNSIIEDRRANPRHDLASMLANATFDDGEPMGLIETLGYYLIVFNAGHDTTRHSLSAALEAFADNPDEFRRLKDDPALVPSAVEEVVRWSAPVNYMKRTVVHDTTFGGVEMKAGQNLALFYASANRDETVFDDPLRFDVGRNPNRHLGFGWAEHYCLGAHLARASIAALLEQMAHRVEVLEPAGTPRQVAASFVVGRKTLPIRYRIAA